MDHSRYKELKVRRLERGILELVNRQGRAAPSLPYEDWLVARLKDPAEAAAYLEAVIEEGDQGALMIALRQIARARGGIAQVARKAKLTREATYKMLSKAGNPELRSFQSGPQGDRTPDRGQTDR